MALEVSVGLWVGHLAGDQGPGFNPDSVLLSSERFPCHPLCCLFGRPCVGREGCALSRGLVAVPGARGCGAASPAPRPGGTSPFPAQRGGHRSIRSLLLHWQVQLVYGQALERPEGEAGCQQLSRAGLVSLKPL